MKKRRVIQTVFALGLATAALGLFGSQPTEAIEGWTKDSGEWLYLDREDQIVTERWKESKGRWYYLSTDGTMLKHHIFKWGSSNYYVDKDGRMITNGWVEIDETVAQDGSYEEGWYYFGSDGKGYARKDGGLFKFEISGETFVFDENGKMLTGFITSDGTVVDEENKFVDATYYANSDGVLYNKQWLHFGVIDNLTGLGGSELKSTLSGRSYSEYESLWMYFDEEGKKVYSKDNEIRQRYIDGQNYAFDEYGIMVPWWSNPTVTNVIISGTTPTSNPTVTDTEKLNYFSGYDGGKMLKNKWFWMYPSENLSQVDYDDQESSWFYAGPKGELYRNAIRSIGGKKYVFDGLGRMQIGFVLFSNSDSLFVARYDTDSLSSADFAKPYLGSSRLNGSNANDLYLFSTDELNDGSMQTGEIQVSLEDGVFTFGFSPYSGIAYGSQDGLAMKQNKYYSNGLRLEAPDDFGYGLVEEFEENSSGVREPKRYRVVDSSGRIIRGSKRVVKDKEGGYIMIKDGLFAGYDVKHTRRWTTVGGTAGFYKYDKDAKSYITGSQVTDSYIPGTSPSNLMDDVPAEMRLNFD